MKEPHKKGVANRLDLEIVALTRASPSPLPVSNSPDSPPSLNTASTLPSAIAAPESPASLGTRTTLPGATRNCFPPVSIIACMGAFKTSLAPPSKLTLHAPRHDFGALTVKLEIRSSVRRRFFFETIYHKRIGPDSSPAQLQAEFLDGCKDRVLGLILFAHVNSDVIGAFEACHVKYGSLYKMRDDSGDLLGIDVREALMGYTGGKLVCFRQ